MCRLLSLACALAAWHAVAIEPLPRLLPHDLVEGLGAPRLVGLYPYPEQVPLRGSWTDVRRPELLLAEVRYSDVALVEAARASHLDLLLNEAPGHAMPALGHLLVDDRGRELSQAGAHEPGRAFFVFIADVPFTSATVEWSMNPARQSNAVARSRTAPALTLLASSTLPLAAGLISKDEGGATWGVVLEYRNEPGISNLVSLVGAQDSRPTGEQGPTESWSVRAATWPSHRWMQRRT